VRDHPQLLLFRSIWRQIDALRDDAKLLLEDVRRLSECGMLQGAGHKLVTWLPGEAVKHQVEALGRSVRDHHLVSRCGDESGYCDPRALVDLPGQPLRFEAGRTNGALPVEYF